MKKLLIWFIIPLTLQACKKEPYYPEPYIDFLIGHLDTTNRMIHVVDYENQDTVIKSDLDTAIAITVIENNLSIPELDTLEIGDLEFTIYVNTLLDNERFTTDKNVYSIGRGMGRNFREEVTVIDNTFIIPIRITDSKVNNNKVEISTQSDYLRISYESLYSGLSKVKTVKIIN